MYNRQITEKEFINYAKGMGNYCTYGDTLKIIEAIFQAFKQAMGSESAALGDLLPESIKPLWKRLNCSGQAGGSIIDLIQNYGSLSSRSDAEKALVAFWGTIKEKQASYASRWEELIPEEIKTYWEKSRTIDESQDARQCV